MRMPGARLAGLGLLVLMASCTNDEVKPFRPASVQEAASIHLSPISIAPWEDYVSLLQPQFTLAAGDAVNLAMQRSAYSQDALVKAFSGGAQIGLRNSTSSGSYTTLLNGAPSAAAGSGPAPAANTGVQTSSNGPGTIPSYPMPAAYSAPADSAATGVGNNPSLDPMADYMAGTAIYQEVKLLNNYVKDAVQRYGYVPYVARVQLSLSPFAHNEPYDAYVDMSTFSTCDGNDARPALAIPLLVTDDIETEQATNSTNIARQLALSLGGIVDNVALQAGVSDLKAHFKAVLGLDYNSLYMVSRAADNVIQVRLGAARNPNLDVNYSMVTQTHYVNFLLLVDKRFTPGASGCAVTKDINGQINGGPQIWINTYTRLRDAMTGAPLPVNRELIQERALEVVKRSMPLDSRPVIKRSLDDPADKLTYDDVAPMLSELQKNNYPLFHEKFCAAIGREPDQCSLGQTLSVWAGFASVLSMTEYAGTFFELPGQSDPADIKDQAVVLHDDCKGSVTATVAGLGALASQKLNVSLALSKGVVLSATAAPQADASGSLTVSFPSLAPYEDLASAIKPSVDAACSLGTDGHFSHKVARLVPAPDSGNPPPYPLLTINEVRSSRWTTIDDAADGISRTFTNLYYDAALKATDNSVSLLPATYGAISAAKDGTGQAQVAVKLGPDIDYGVLSFNGATLAAGLPANALSTDSVSLRVNASGLFTVNLSGMALNPSVLMTLQGYANNALVPGAGTTLVIPITHPAPVAAAKPAKKAKVQAAAKPAKAGGAKPAAKT